MNKRTKSKHQMKAVSMLIESLCTYRILNGRITSIARRALARAGRHCHTDIWYSPTSLYYPPPQRPIPTASPAFSLLDTRKPTIVDGHQCCCFAFSSFEIISNFFFIFNRIFNEYFIQRSRVLNTPYHTACNKILQPFSQTRNARTPNFATHTYARANRYNIKYELRTTFAGFFFPLLNFNRPYKTKQIFSYFSKQLYYCV